VAGVQGLIKWTADQNYLPPPSASPTRYAGAMRTWRKYSITPSLHHSITPSLHHSITPSLHHSITPSLRAAGFEDEDDGDDEDENENDSILYFVESVGEIRP
jgi:hypothetical protein